jgi:regulator of protease activity HflC (stomatin/prohibitin superfamily)
MISGLAKLVDLFIQLFKLATPWTVVNSYQRGVILRLGGGSLRSEKNHPYSRVIGPMDGFMGTGLHFMVPFIEDVMRANIVPAMASYPNQVFSSAKGTTFLTLVHVLWRVEDIVTFLLDVEDAADVLSDAAAGITRRLIASMNDEELIGTALEAKLITAVRSRTKRFGVYVESVYISELAPTSLRGGIMRVEMGKHLE